MASEIPLRPARLPSPQQVRELLEGEFGRAGYEVEDVTIDAAARPPRVVVIADGDDGLDLEALATLSRTASELLDQLDDSDETPYLLEVTSRGVDRPLTEERHYRRARGRRIEVTLTDGSQLTGRVGALTDRHLELVVADRRAGPTIRTLSIDDVANAVVQVEFSSPNPLELELAGVSGKEVEE
ncbi:ribosome maturation factor RimP [Mycolicibacterium madagascariense]|uniref:Ribosome maturation factor RimP n=1 Tax=Mycolicibacterium madagascariense TaxID=212765 RepID=A0A7I7XFL1_9MYCO|nr:ribosome maturation factor RimP [Mycolicibacterium madagascariense]BBZ27966.1 ribosome maturation factor RimP [Mycolicibacterium madagascariense]